MKFSIIPSIRIAAVGLSLFAGVVSAQDKAIILEPPKGPLALAAGNNLYCAGYVQKAGVSTDNRIIGGQDEADKYNYAQNDFVYINSGRGKGVAVGDRFAVIRPRGAVKSQWTDKSVGFYVQEVGMLEVVDVKQDVSVARVRISCDTFLLGDLVQMTPERVSPMDVKLDPLDRFAGPTGKAQGRILFARDGHEMITRDQIAYIDLGQDENVRVGDRVTIFRALDKGNVTTSPQGETGTSRDYGFQSEVYQGGRYSNQSGRKSGETADGREITTERAKKGRPFLRKVVGEAVVLNVKERTATIVITRTAQEIHTGDWVELK